MRKTVAAAAMAASLTVGGAAGVALFTPTLSGAQTDSATTEAETEEIERPRLTERLRGHLDPLVEDGTIDDSQADAVAEHLAEEAPFRHGHHRGPGFGPGFGGAVLDVLGLDAAELREQLASGQSLREIAEANGVDVDALVEAMLTAHEEHLADAVADGRLTEEQAAEREATLEAHVQDLLDRTFDGRPGQHGRHGTTGT